MSLEIKKKNVVVEPSLPSFLLLVLGLTLWLLTPFKEPDAAARCDVSFPWREQIHHGGM